MVRAIPTSGRTFGALSAQSCARGSVTTSKPVGYTAMARARSPVRLAEAVRAISALGGCAGRYAPILAVRGRVDVMALSVDVVPVLHERGFIRTLAVVLVAWRPGK